MKHAPGWTILRICALAILGALGFAIKWRSNPGQPLTDNPETTQSSVGPGFRPAPGPVGPSEAGGTGSGASRPTEIPPKGWWQITKRVFNEVSEDRLMAEAAGVTFYVLLAMFPAIATLVSLYGIVADPRTISDNISMMAGILPSGGLQILHDQIVSLTSGPPKALGFGVVIGLLASSWSANAGIKALFDALNVVYDEKEKRSFVARTLLTLAFTLGGLVFVVIALTAVVVLPTVLNFVGLGHSVDMALQLARWPVLLVVLSVFLAAVYRYGPSRLKARWRWVSWGGAAATLCWIVVSLAFSYYVQNFGSYNKTYGSLGAVIGFMTWIWLSTTVVLIGAELDAEMEHQTARDTTAGPEKPLGQRNATMADQVAT